MAEGTGDIRELPKGWMWVHHKVIAEINPRLPFSDLSDGLVVSFLPMAAVEEKSGRYSLSDVREYGKVKKGYNLCKNYALYGEPKSSCFRKSHKCNRFWIDRVPCFKTNRIYK
jgi:hypothetical protein